MNKIINGFSGLIMSLVEIVIGVLLLINPIGFTSKIIIGAGIILSIIGVYQSIMYFTSGPREATLKSYLTKGLSCIALGIFCIFKYKWFIATFAIITVLYGLVIVFTGIGKLQNSLDMARIKLKYWYIALIGAILTLAFGIIIIFNPFKTTATLWSFMGVVLIFIAVIDAITFFVSKKRDRKKD